MSEPIDYPQDATGPHTAVLPNVANGHNPPPYAFQPTGPIQQPNFAPKPNRLNKVAAIVGIAAGALVIVAVLFGGGFYLGRTTAPTPQVRSDRTASPFEQGGGPIVIPMPRGQFPQQEPGIQIPNGPTIQLPNLFPQLPMPGQTPSTQVPGQPPR